MTAPARLARVGVGTSAEAQAERVILGLLAGYFGHDRRGAGLLVKRGERYHTPRCPFGQWLAPGDSLRGGQPCSERCAQIAAAVEQAADWLKAHEQPMPQPALFGDAAAAAGR